MPETGSDASILELSPAERRERDVEPADVRDALVDVLHTGTKDEKVFEDCTFPALDLDYEVVEGADNHPAVFRNCTFEAEISVENAEVSLPLVFEDCQVGALEFYHARFEYDVEFHDSTIAGPVVADETRFEQDAEFDRVVFEGPVEIVETAFGDDTTFDGATFQGEAIFQRSTFAGTSNRFDDNVSFDGATFENVASFAGSTFEANRFDAVTFGDDAEFAETVFRGDTEFTDVTVAGTADFTEAECHDDADFEGATFEGEADFEGALFTGGARSLEDDLRFVDAVFDGPANFRHAQFRYCNFGSAAFRDAAAFTESWFDADADFDGATFDADARFEETRFREDADFSACTFRAAALFGGAVFEGEAKHIEDNATFENATFEADADFSATEFTSANFESVAAAGLVDFTDATFEDALDVEILAADGEQFVDLTNATIKGGTITQPADGWVRYDLTEASLGDIAIRSEGSETGQQVLDYFRFCRTVFDEFDGNEFDFSDHGSYLDRNGWNVHSFHDPTDRDYAVEMTPESIETTYLNAKNSASSAGDMKAAGEFRTKRQQYARRKHLRVARDDTAGTVSRLKNGVRAAENAFLGVTCGHGVRIFRIFGVFAVTPALFAPFYAFGGRAFATSAGQTSLAALSTPEGQATFFKLLSFSYITFLTIGYGNVGPQGWAARILVALEVYVSVILGGLVLYALIKRSEM